MIATLTMNPCIDKTVEISNFYYGDINRVIKKRKDVSGKGINVSIALSNLGVPVRTFGLLYENDGERFLKSLKKLGIEYENVPVEGCLRENVKVYNNVDNVTTELNENGAHVSQEKVLEFISLLENAMDSIDILVVTGSLPSGIDPGFYKEIIEKAKEHDIKCILDAEGAPLLKGMEAKPYMIKPNLFEFKEAFGLKTEDMDEVLKKCGEIIQDGVEVVCLSMGEKGAVITDGRNAYRCRPVDTDVKSTQGAGDSMVAGMCMALEENLGLDSMLKYGVSVAQGSLMKEGTQMCEKEDFENFVKTVVAEPLL